MRKPDGFSLLELIIVVSVLAVVISIAVPTVLGTVNESRRVVCLTNALELEKQYEVYLSEHQLDHQEAVFNSFVEENNFKCPSKGTYTYSNGRIKCSVHQEVEETEEVEPVPFL